MCRFFVKSGKKNMTTKQKLAASKMVENGGNIGKAMVAAGYAVTATCNTINCAATATAWCLCGALKATTTSETFCVDSTGAKKKTTTACATECSQTSATPGLCL